MEITPVLPNARQKFQIYHGIYGIFHVISIFLLLLPLKPGWETLLYELPDDMVQDRSCKHCGTGYDAPCGCHAMPLLISPRCQLKVTKCMYKVRK